MNREVNLTKLVKTSKGPRYCTVVWATNGRIRPDVVMVNGQPERHTEGAYYLEWREGNKRIRLSVPTMTLVGNHKIEGVDWNVQLFRLFIKFLISSGKDRVPPKQIDRHTLNRAYVDESMTRVGVRQIGTR